MFLTMYSICIGPIHCLLFGWFLRYDAAVRFGACCWSLSLGFGACRWELVVGSLLLELS